MSKIFCHTLFSGKKRKYQFRKISVYVLVWSYILTDTLKHFLSSFVAVQCGLAPIPQFGMIVYDTIVRGNTTHYGLKGTYKCLPPNVLIGDARAACTANGNWTKTPECRGMRVRKAEASVRVPILVYFTFKEVLTIV